MLNSSAFSLHQELPFRQNAAKLHKMCHLVDFRVVVSTTDCTFAFLQEYIHNHAQYFQLKRESSPILGSSEVCLTKLQSNYLK